MAPRASEERDERARATRDRAPSARSAPRCAGALLRTWGRRGAKAIARAVVPSSFVVWRGRVRRTASGRRPIAITFDDGPGELTAEYLDVLARFGARATFFVVGELCAARPDLVAAIAAGGHELSGHGYTHRRFPTLSPAELRRELTRTAALLPRPTGARLVRPPHGAVSLASTLTCARAGFTVALWTHDSGDWRTTDAEEVCAALHHGRALEPGAVVLLHEGQRWTLEALPRLLGKWSEAGHDLVPMGELLGG